MTKKTTPYLTVDENDGGAGAGGAKRPRLSPNLVAAIAGRAAQRVA